MNEQTTIALFIDFELILYVAIERFEHFDDKNCEIIFVENIWLRDVANEINEHSIVDFFLILHVNSCVKSRKSKFLIDFRTWCWRICSWNLLLKLKFCLQRLQIRTQTICLIENFFIDFDANSNVDNWKIVRSIFNFTRIRTIWTRIFAIDFAKIFAIFAVFVIEFDIFFAYSNVISNVVIEKFERFDESICKTVFVFDIKFSDVACETNDLCEIDKSMIVFFFLFCMLIWLYYSKKNEQMFENSWTKIIWNSDSNVENDDFDEIKKHEIDLFSFEFDTISDVWIEKCVFFCEMIVLKINVDSNICFDVAIETCNSNETNEFITINFFFVAHNDLIVLNVKNVFVKAISKSCKKMKFDWFSNQISTKS